MAIVRFARAFQTNVGCPSETVRGATVREVLEAYFAVHPAVRGYVLDDQGVVRRHVGLFVRGSQLVDRSRLTDPMDATDELYVMQALSGG
jgi:sulfur-carrier protein